MELTAMTANYGLDGRAMLLKLHKAVAALLVNLDLSQRTIDRKVGPHISFSGLGRNVANVNIGVRRIGTVHSIELEGVGGLLLLMLSPAHTNATRSNLPSLHSVDGGLSILFASERHKAIALGSASGMVPHDTSIPARKGKVISYLSQPSKMGLTSTGPQCRMCCTGQHQ